MDTSAADAVARTFFDAYGADLLARDAAAIAGRYAVPGLILFPGSSVPVSSAEQTGAFFADAFAQYEGVTEASSDLTVLAATGHSIWVDCTWRYNTGATERMVYQLVGDGSSWRIAVLTPLE